MVPVQGHLRETQCLSSEVAVSQIPSSDLVLVLGDRRRQDSDPRARFSRLNLASTEFRATETEYLLTETEYLLD